MSDPLPGRTSDRNLLFGILALQMDFISREQLVAAMHAWVLAKEKPLGQILQEQGALAADAEDLLEALVQKHIQMHGNDPQKSLAAASAGDSVRQALEQVADADLQASLADTPVTQSDDGAPGVTRVTAAGSPTSCGLRFTILRPHASGGLGQVHIARDEELRREVALKEIQKRYADDPRSRARFLLEAEVTGGLEHPGVVPVYGLGTYPDGRPFYAMRFIRGDSLQEAIARFHQAEGPARDRGERALAFRGLLGRFVDVCQAIGYAHSRGVLHRDLKPGNIMLGKYGETLVVDWGVAKPTGQAFQPVSDLSEGPLVPCSGDGSSATQAGQLLGTPAFMSPEQAAGRVDLVGPASDIYGLGATLYALLTGRAPVKRPDSGEVIRRAVQGDWPLPGQVKKDVPKALEAVCCKAMALKPEDRYAAALELAGEIEHWLADEPVQAYPDPLRARAGRWARRHQPLVAATTAAALVALVLGGSGAWWLDRQRARQAAGQAEQEARLRQAVESDLNEVERLEGEARWDAALAALGRADARLADQGPQDLRSRMNQVRHDLDLVARLDATRLRAATWLVSQFDEAGTAREYATAFRDAGLGQPGEDPEAVAASVRGLAVRASVVAALDDWAVRARMGPAGAWALAVARSADPGPWKDRFRDLTVRHNRAALRQLASEAEVTTLAPQTLVALALLLEQHGVDTVPLLQAAQTGRVDDFWINFQLGVALRKAERNQEALGYFRAAVALRPQASAARVNLGNALSRTGRVDDAIAEYQKAVVLDAGNAPARANLGAALTRKGRLDEAIGELDRAIALEPKSALTYHHLGDALYAKGRVDDAIAAYRRALALGRGTALLHSRLGQALNARGRPDDAIAEYQRSLVLEPSNALRHYNLGVALQARGRLDDALAEYQRAIALDPKPARAHINLAGLLQAKARPDDAIAEYQKAIALDPKFAPAHFGLGLVLQAKRDWAGADAAYRAAIDLKPGYAEAHCNRGAVLRERGRLAESLAEYRRGHELGPKQPGWSYPSEEWVRKAERLVALEGELRAYEQGKHPPADNPERLGLAQVARLTKRYPLAARLYVEAFAADPKLATDLEGGHRYNAACCAARSSTGQGAGAVSLNENERARWRQQALHWLGADLASRKKQLDNGRAEQRKEVQAKLRYWQQDPDLGGVGDPAALAKLPEAERQAWQKFWQDVEATLATAGEKK